ncbi:unnamed protein product [Boreogadus saida]
METEEATQVVVVVVGRGPLTTVSAHQQLVVYSLSRFLVTRLKHTTTRQTAMVGTNTQQYCPHPTFSSRPPPSCISCPPGERPTARRERKADGGEGRARERWLRVS